MVSYTRIFIHEMSVVCCLWVWIYVIPLWCSYCHTVEAFPHDLNSSSHRNCNWKPCVVYFQRQRRTQSLWRLVLVEIPTAWLMVLGRIALLRSRSMENLERRNSLIPPTPSNWKRVRTSINLKVDSKLTKLSWLRKSNSSIDYADQGKMWHSGH